MAANRTKDATFLGARYRRLTRRTGKLKALVAIQHSILTAVWHVLSENTGYHDLGGGYHAKRDPQRALRRITRDANRLGYTVRFDRIQAAAHRGSLDSPPFSTHVAGCPKRRSANCAYSFAICSGVVGPSGWNHCTSAVHMLAIAFPASGGCVTARPPALKAAAISASSRR